MAGTKTKALINQQLELLCQKDSDNHGHNATKEKDVLFLSQLTINCWTKGKPMNKCMFWVGEDTYDWDTQKQLTYSEAT